MKTQEQLKRDMYAALDKIRRAKKHPSATAVFEAALEMYLESVRTQTPTAEQLLRERDDLQGRLHAVDTAYAESQELNRIAGEELREAQQAVRDWHEETDRLSERTDRAEAVALKWKTKAAEQLIVIKSQREAFGELYVKHHLATRAKPKPNAKHPSIGLV